MSPVHPEVEYAWAAGFLDGEGYFQGLNGTGRCANGFRLQIAASQVGRRAPIDQLQMILGGHVYEICREQSGRGARAGTYKWSLADAIGIREALPLIIPFLIVKRREAELLFQLANLVQVRSPGKGLKRYTPEQRIEMQELIDGIRLARRNFACSSG